MRTPQEKLSVCNEYPKPESKTSNSFDAIYDIPHTVRFGSY
jgi:hypothetical protein